MSKQRREQQKKRHLIIGLDGKEIPSELLTYGDALKAVTEQAQAEGRVKPGEIGHIDVYHDDWCALLAGKGLCNCNPEVRLPKRSVAPEDN